MSSKILISTAEYHALKQRHSQEPHLREKLDDITAKTIVQHENKQLQEDLQPHSQEVNQGTEDWEDNLSFLPSNKRGIAKHLLEDLLLHPDVHVHNGILHIKDKRIGHLVTVLHSLYGDKKAADRNFEYLQTFLRMLGYTQGYRRSANETERPVKTPPKKNSTMVKKNGKKSAMTNNNNNKNISAHHAKKKLKWRNLNAFLK